MRTASAPARGSSPASSSRMNALNAAAAASACPTNMLPYGYSIVPSPIAMTAASRAQLEPVTRRA